MASAVGQAADTVGWALLVLQQSLPLAFLILLTSLPHSLNWA